MIAYQESPYGAYDAYVHQQQLQSAVAEAAARDIQHQRQQMEQAYFQQEQQQQHHQQLVRPEAPLEDIDRARAHLDRLFSGLASSAGMLPPPHPFAGRVSGYTDMNAGYPAQHGYYAPHAQNHDVLRNAGFAFIPGPGQYPSTTFGQPQFVSATDPARRHNESQMMLPPPHPTLQPAFEHVSSVPYPTLHAGAYQPVAYEAPRRDAAYESEQWTVAGEELTHDDLHQDQAVNGNEYGYLVFAPAAVQRDHYGERKRKQSKAVKMEEAAIASAESLDLIAPDASAIPPPPPIAKSAHPLAALATDLVWEAFLAAANNNSPPSSSPAQFASVDRSGRGRFDDGSPVSRRSGRISASPGGVNVFQRTPSKQISPYVNKHDRSRSASAGLDGEKSATHAFGAIGGERKPRLSLESSPGSDSSSPASSAPGTPAMDSWLVSSTANEGGHGLSRLGESGYWTDEENGAVPTAKQSLPPLSSLLRPSAFQQQQQRFGGVTPPLALFEQIQKLLGATLLSQQVLLLALYYVSRIPYTSPLYPPATSQSALQSTSAPFKLLLAALVVANKHLDDNSFRNSTFAQVANITVPEVNALEYSLLGDLNFDVNVETPVWLAWLRELQGHQATRFIRDQVSSSAIILELIGGVGVQTDELELSREQGRHAISLGPDGHFGASIYLRKEYSMDFFGASMTPRSESSMSGGFDLDAAGPLEERPRYSKQFCMPPNIHDRAIAGSRQYCGGIAEEEAEYGRMGYDRAFERSSSRMILA